MSDRRAAIRTAAVIGIGLAVLAAILYYASTVDGRAPVVLRVSVTQHLTGDVDAALTTSSVEVDFSEPVDRATAEAAFGISPEVAGAFSWSAATLTFTPSPRLPLRTEFVVTIDAGVRDAAGNEMNAAAAPFHFTTVGNPSVVASDPADGAQDVVLDQEITVDFSTLMDTAAVEAALRIAPATPLRMRWARERLTVEPAVPLDPDRRYTLTIGVGARDQAGTPLDVPFTLAFRTIRSSLQAGTLVPADGVAGVAVGSPIAIVFDKPLDPGSLRDDLLRVVPAVAGSLDIIAAPGAAGLADPEPRILRFTPSGPLEPNTTYEVTLRPGLVGADGTGLPADLTWSFTTGAPAATLSNQVVFVSDRAGIANLWAMNPDGSNQRQLSAELSPVIDYAVAPDGRAFVVGDGAVLVWERADGTARRLLTDAGMVEFDPAFSPDGGTLVFGRADATHGGLGIWMRDGDGSDPRPVQLANGETAAPSPSPAVPAPLLRAPRISPDGRALAFVDDAGTVSILDLETGAVSGAGFLAVSAPAWLPDGSGVLVSGLSSGPSPSGYLPGTAVPRLDPSSLGLEPAALGALRVVRVDRGSSIAEATPMVGGAAIPTVDPLGRIAYLELSATGAGTGTPWISVDERSAGEPVRGLSSGSATFLSFAPEPDTIVVARVAGEDATDTAGVWRVDLVSGSATRISLDGGLSRWLP